MLGKINWEAYNAPGLGFHELCGLVTLALNFLFGLLGSCWLGLRLLAVLLAFRVHPLDLELSFSSRCTYCMHVQ